MAEEKTNGWKLNRQIDLSFVVQLMFLASLIIGSWVNLQRQLDSLQKDVNLLIDGQKKFEQRIEDLSAKSIAYEYRMKAVEKQVNGANVKRPE
jgi:hypothetical protein